MQNVIPFPIGGRRGMRARKQRKFSTRRTKTAAAQKSENTSANGHPETSQTGEKQSE